MCVGVSGTTKAFSEIPKNAVCSRIAQIFWGLLRKTGLCSPCSLGQQHTCSKSANQSVYQASVAQRLLLPDFRSFFKRMFCFEVINVIRGNFCVPQQSVELYNFKNDNNETPFGQKVGTGKIHVLLQNSNALNLHKITWFM